MKTFFIIAVSMFMIVLMAAIANWAVDEKEQGDCQTWATQATQFPEYYITHWQKQQCDRWKVDISAPIR